MVWYWGILSVVLPSRKEAYDFRRVMYQENGIKRHKMFVIRQGGGWRVIRRIHEFELDDPLLGDADRIAEYRRYLKMQTRRVKRWLRGRKL